MQTRSTQKSESAIRGFWSSKLGHASLASIAAMSAMVILSSQVPANAAAHSTGYGAGVMQLHSDTAALVEIA